MHSAAKPKTKRLTTNKRKARTPPTGRQEVGNTLRSKDAPNTAKNTNTDNDARPATATSEVSHRARAACTTKYAASMIRRVRTVFRDGDPALATVVTGRTRRTQHVGCAA
jgi:hypothetical protein